MPNEKAIEWTIKLGLALGCDIADHAVFHRKNYFYPDNPKGYQISQYDEPLCISGSFLVPGAEGDMSVGIVRAHLEEDAAKNVHMGGGTGRIHGADRTLVDFNRAGHAAGRDRHRSPTSDRPSRPSASSSCSARPIRELGISDAEMQEGSMRFDVNVSVRPEGSDELRTRTELKNINSFNFAAQGIEREIRRQVAIYESGGQIEQETLHFVPGQEHAAPLRSKEEAQDYRYFPEPDLVPIEPPAEMVDARRRGASSSCRARGSSGSRTSSISASRRSS